MRYRSHMIGGDLGIRSPAKRGRGVVVTVVAPMLKPTNRGKQPGAKEFTHGSRVEMPDRVRGGQLR